MSTERREHIRVVACDRHGRILESIREVLDADGTVTESVRTTYLHPVEPRGEPSAVSLDLKSPDSLWEFARRSIVAQSAHGLVDVRPVLELLARAKMQLQIMDDNELVTRMPPTLSTVPSHRQ
jgi:hypothetical protein